MKIATFNANSIRARLAVVLAWLQRESPDVLCIQETKVQDAQFPVQPFKDAGYHAVFRGEKSYNGVALLCRQEPQAVRFGLDDGPEADATRLVAARVGGIHVVNTYVPQGRALDHPMYRYKLAWFERLTAYFSAHYARTDPVVWAGDLNVAPGPLDVHDPASMEGHVCYHHEVRAAFERTMRWGFTDLLRKHHPEPGQFTFFDYRTPNAVKRKLGWRIDHILATAPLADVCTDCRIDVEPRLGRTPSDHTVLVATFAGQRA